MLKPRLSGGPPMPATVYRVATVLCALVAGVPVGTNLGLVLVLWMLLTGRLLATRGAVIPGLNALGLTPQLGGRRARGVERRPVAGELAGLGSPGRRVAAASGGRIPPGGRGYDGVLATAPARVPDPAL